MAAIVMVMMIVMAVAVVIGAAIAVTGIIATTTKAQEADAGIGRRVTVAAIAIPATVVRPVIHVNTAAHGRDPGITVTILIVGHTGAEGGGTQDHPSQRKEFCFHN